MTLTSLTIKDIEIWRLCKANLAKNGKCFGDVAWDLITNIAKKPKTTLESWMEIKKNGVIDFYNTDLKELKHILKTDKNEAVKFSNRLDSFLRLDREVTRESLRRDV